MNESDVLLPVAANKLWQRGSWQRRKANRDSPNEEEQPVKPSTQDRTEGKLHEVKGKIKEEVGKVTNNPGLEVSGKAEKNAGKVQKWVGSAEKVVGE